MTKDWSNLKNQPKKVDEAEETVDEAELEAEETEAKAEEETVEEEVEETPAEKKAREKAEKKAQAEGFAEIYFVNEKTLNLATMVGEFVNGLFIAKTFVEAEEIRKTEDFQWGFVKEMSEKEFKKSKE